MPRRFSLPLLTLLIGLALAPQASAQATRTWVSGVGDDVNPCSRTAPCKTFAGAISKTAEYGEINAIDSGPFGALTITKSITIDVTSVKGGVLTSLSQSGMLVNAQPDDNVILRGLDIHGAPAAGAACAAGHGVRILNARSVRIEDSTITQLQRAISVEPSAATDVLVNRVEMGNNCVAGVLAAPGATGSARVSIANSSISNSGTAVSAGPRSEAWIGNTTIFGNALGFDALDGGKINDWGDNRVSGNTTDGAVTTVLNAPAAGPQGAAGPTGPTGATGVAGADGVTGPVALQVLLAQERLSVAAGRNVKVRFITTTAATGRLTITRAGRTVARVTKKLAAGANTMTWNGKAGARKAKAGRYRAILSVAGAGQRTTAEAPLRLR
jgi:hypothetical protein